jgi:hypothetical protein
LTWGLWIDWERLRVKDMFRTFNSFLSARDANNRQGQCDASLDQPGPNSKLKPTRLHRKRLQQRQRYNHKKSNMMASQLVAIDSDRSRINAALQPPKARFSQLI